MVKLAELNQALKNVILNNDDDLIAQEVLVYNKYINELINPAYHSDINNKIGISLSVLLLEERKNCVGCLNIENNTSILKLINKMHNENEIIHQVYTKNEIIMHSIKGEQILGNCFNRCSGLMTIKGINNIHKYLLYWNELYETGLINGSIWNPPLIIGIYNQVFN